MKVYLDTNYYIYYLEGHSLATQAQPFLQKALEGRIEIIASALILQEILTGVYKDAREEVEETYALLVSFPNITWCSYHIQIADKAAELAAQYRIRAPDAIHLATALNHGVQKFLSYDKKLQNTAKILGL